MHTSVYLVCKNIYYNSNIMNATLDVYFNTPKYKLQAILTRIH